MVDLKARPKLKGILEAIEIVTEDLPMIEVYSQDKGEIVYYGEPSECDVYLNERVKSIGSEQRENHRVLLMVLQDC